MECNSSSENPLVSIIVPAYNAEGTLRRCLDSLLKQTYSRYEVIVVNDGSCDGTREICESYSEIYQSIRIVSKENGGQSSARNAGIDAATGDYIMFCDSDDYVSFRIVESLMKVALETKSDIVECMYAICHGNYDQAINSIGCGNCELTVDGKEAVIRFVLDYGLVTVAPWGKLYAAHLFEGVRFSTELSRYEDDALMPYLAESAARYSRINAPLYAYCIRENSVMTSPYSKNDLQLMKIFDTRLEYFGRKYGESIATLIRYRYLLAMNEMLAVHGERMEASDRKMINDKRRSLIRSIGTFSGAERKAMALFTTLFPQLAHELRRIKKSKEFSFGMS